MPTSQTILEHTEINHITGQVFIRWRKQITADNGEVVFAEPHRTSLEPAHYAQDGKTVIAATSLAAQLVAVSTQLQSLGWPALAATDVTTIAALDTVRPTLAPVVIQPLAPAAPSVTPAA